MTNPGGAAFFHIGTDMPETVRTILAGLTEIDTAFNRSQGQHPGRNEFLANLRQELAETVAQGKAQLAELTTLTGNRMGTSGLPTGQQNLGQAAKDIEQSTYQAIERKIANAARSEQGRIAGDASFFTSFARTATQLAGNILGNALNENAKALQGRASQIGGDAATFIGGRRGHHVEQAAGRAAQNITPLRLGDLTLPPLSARAQAEAIQSQQRITQQQETTAR